MNSDKITIKPVGLVHVSTAPLKVGQSLSIIATEPIVVDGFCFPPGTVTYIGRKKRRKGKVVVYNFLVSPTKFST